MISDADTAAFQTLRPRLFGIAYRVLGDAPEADDVVQDAWIRWHGTDRGGVRDPAAFLATTTTRLAINVGQSARSRRERCTGTWVPERIDPAADPADGAARSEALDRAVRALLERLSPAERAAYVLREAFDYPYRRIAEVAGLSEANARQRVARARRRLSDGPRRPVDPRQHQRLLGAIAAAAGEGDLASLERLLADDVNRITVRTRSRGRRPGATAARVPPTS